MSSVHLAKDGVPAGLEAIGLGEPLGVRRLATRQQRRRKDQGRQALVVHIHSGFHQAMLRSPTVFPLDAAWRRVNWKSNPPLAGRPK